MILHIRISNFYNFSLSVSVFVAIQPGRSHMGIHFLPPELLVLIVDGSYNNKSGGRFKNAFQKRV